MVNRASAHEEISTIKKNVRYINVQNKTGVGGVERIVADFTGELTFSGIHNKTFNLGRSKLTRELLSKSAGRKILFPWRAIELFLHICLSKTLNKKQDLVIIFYHAECHFLFKLLSPFLKFFSRVSTVIYLCQSMSIYPPKLLKSGFSAISSSDLTICYSDLVAQEWRAKTNHEIHSIYSPVKLERLEIYNSQPSNESLNLIHIGRPVSFKTPEKSLKFAIKVSTLCNRVKLTFVGIESLENIDQMQIPSNLEVEFKGIVNDTISLTRNSTALLNLIDFKQSNEVIGVAAIESLCVGVPVVIHSKAQTGYSDLAGIITEKEFIERLTNSLPETKDYKKLFSLNSVQIEDVRKKVSSENFLRELQLLLKLAN